MAYDTVCFGEILFDVFGDKAVPGGAPFNVAYHLKKAGMNSYLVSSIGKDAYGQELLSLLESWDISTDGIQVNDTYPTGKAIVQHDADNQPVFELVFPVAWDHIGWKERYRPVIAGSDAFVFGTLVTRNTHSRQTLMQCLEYATLNVYDVNIRPPHFSRPVIEDLLAKTHILKLNSAELLLLGEWYGAGDRDEPGQVNMLREHFGIPEVIVTKGGDGSSYYGRGEVLHQEAIRVTVADTVGSGDAFLAGFLSKRLNPNASLADAMLAAARRGAYVASQSGACPGYEGFVET
jgi:fructokinase